MSIKIMSRVWDEMPYDQTTLLVLLCLADHADDNGVCWPSIPRIAERARCTERWCRDVIGELEKKGHLERELRPGQTTKYRIVFPMDLVPTPEPQFTPEETSPLNPSSPLPRNPSSGDPGTPVPMNHQEPSVEPSSSVDSPPCAEDYQPMALVGEHVTEEEPKSGFERFWEAFPKREKKIVTKAAWDAAIKGGADPDQIVTGAAGYARQCQQLKRDEQYIAFPANWLREERWTDEYPPPRTSRRDGPWWGVAGNGLD